MNKRVTNMTTSAPRYLIKAVRSCFFPRDNDIVREMWVRGDLKRRLGLKRADSDDSLEANAGKAESKPIRGYHDRSVSSTSRYETGYEPAATHSPGEYEMTPPSTVGILLRKPGAQVGRHPEALSRYSRQRHVDVRRSV